MKLLTFLLLFVCCIPANKIAMDIQEPLKQIVPKNDLSYEPVDEFICYRALQKIRSKYEKLPNEHFEFYPTFMFPFSWLNDTITIPPNYRDIYLINNNLSVRVYKTHDQVHLQVAVLHYVRSKIDPWARIYTLFFMCLDSVKGWQEERDPASVVTVIKKDGTYQAK